MSMEKLKEQYEEDAKILDRVYESLRLSDLKIKELIGYNQNLKTTFDNEVQKAAMKILDSTATGMNDGGGTLVYRGN